MPKNADGQSLEEYPNYTRVMAVLKFIKYALGNQHQKVAGTARKVFYCIARMQAQNATLLKQVGVAFLGINGSELAQNWLLPAAKLRIVIVRVPSSIASRHTPGSNAFLHPTTK